MFVAVLAVFLFTVCLFVGVFWWYGRDYARVCMDRTYYFLVHDCEDTTASAVAGQAYASGGAGYLIEVDGKSAVVLACYFSQTDAERVRTSMSEKGVETGLLALTAEEFTLNAAEEKGRVEANLATVETCARMLYDTANGLERTEVSQEEARAAVRGVVSSLKGLRQDNAGGLYDRWNAELMRAERRGTEIAEGIRFAKDLRYLQVELLLAVIHADTYFS